MRLLSPALVLGAITVAQAATPSFFVDVTPTDRNVFAVIEKYLRGTDFVSTRVFSADTNLRAKLDSSHQFELARGLDALNAEVSRGCGGQSPETTWYLTPLEGTSEFSDPLGSIATALRTIHGAGCHQAGIIPSARFWGYVGPCEYNLPSSPYQKVDWTLVDRVIIQGEGMLKAGCRTGPSDYQKFMTSIIAHVRARNPKIAVYAHVSFRYTPPSVMIQGIAAMIDVVDGFLFSYPLYGDHVYCTAENLEAVLKVFRSPAP